MRDLARPPRRVKRVLVVVDDRRARKHDGYDVEPDERPIAIRLQYIGASSSDNIALLFWTYGAFGAAVIRICAGFDFDKDEHVTITSDDVDFARSVRQPEAASDNVKTLLTEMAVGDVLSLFAGGLREGESAAFAKLTRGVDQAPEQLARRQEPG